MILLLGKNGSGKTYTAKYLEKSGLKKSISCTTRPPRPFEIDHEDYHFITKEQFEEMINNNEFVEYKQFRDCYYGTPRINMEEADIFISGSQIDKNIIPYIDNIYYIDSPLDMRYHSMLSRNLTNEELIDRLHGENKDYLFDYKTKIFYNYHQKSFTESVLKSIIHPDLVEAIPFRQFLENCVDIYKEKDGPKFLKFLNYEEYFIRKLYLEGKLTAEEYEEGITRFLYDKKYSFLETEDQYMIDFDNDRINCKKLVKK